MRNCVFIWHYMVIYITMNVKVLREIREVILKIRNMDSARRENTEHKPYHIPRVMAEKRKNASVR